MMQCFLQKIGQSCRGIPCGCPKISQTNGQGQAAAPTSFLPLCAFVSLRETILTKT